MGPDCGAMAPLILITRFRKSGSNIPPKRKGQKKTWKKQYFQPVHSYTLRNKSMKVYMTAVCNNGRTMSVQHPPFLKRNCTLYPALSITSKEILPNPDERDKCLE
jgi:hypothetical protein